VTLPEVLAELVRTRKTLEADLRALISARISQFSGLTRLFPSHVNVNMVEITMMGDLIGPAGEELGRRYIVSSVDVTLEL